jgi:hypothetical protein
MLMLRAPHAGAGAALRASTTEAAVCVHSRRAASCRQARTLSLHTARLVLTRAHAAARRRATHSTPSCSACSGMRWRACLRRLHTAALAKQPQARAPQPHCSCAALALTPRRARVRSSAAAVRGAVGVCWPARRGRRGRTDVNGMHRNAARAHLLSLLTRAVHLRRVQSIADASGLVTAEVAVRVAFFSAVAFLNGITQKSVRGQPEG